MVKFMFHNFKRILHEQNLIHETNFTAAPKQLKCNKSVSIGMLDDGVMLCCWVHTLKRYESFHVFSMFVA